EAGAGPATPHAVLERGMAVLVVDPASRRVGQHLVSLLAFLERRFRSGITRIAVRVVLHRAASVGLLELLGGRVARDAEDLVVVALAQPCFPSPSLTSVNSASTTSSARGASP